MVVYVCVDVGGIDKGDGFDVWVVVDCIDYVFVVVYDVEYVFGNVCFQCQFDQVYGDYWVLFGWFQNEGIVGCDCYWEYLQWDYCWEVEWGDVGVYVEWLQQGVGVYVIGDVVGQFVELQVVDCSGVFDYFQVVEYIVFGVWYGFVLFGGQDMGQFVYVFVDELLVFQEDVCMGVDGGFVLGFEGFFGCSDGGVYFIGGCEWYLGQDVLGGWIDYVLLVWVG